LVIEQIRRFGPFKSRFSLTGMYQYALHHLVGSSIQNPGRVMQLSCAPRTVTPLCPSNPGQGDHFHDATTSVAISLSPLRSAVDQKQDRRTPGDPGVRRQAEPVVAGFAPAGAPVIVF
jgi:hypothetical protein